MSNELHVKYRPRTLADVVGQDDAVKSLAARFKDGKPAHAYLFTGPSGTGKTTLARIVAAMAGCEDGNVLEVDAASTSGADEMRAVVSNARHVGFGASPNRAVIVDECHSLSKQAWQVLLKPLEEPPPHLFFMLCTTEPSKVPSTVETRCQAYRLRDVPHKAIARIVDDVAEKEGIKLDDETFDHVVEAAQGSPRRALTLLAKVAGVAGSPRDAARLLERVEDTPEVIDLCRALADRASWPELVRIAKGIQGDNYEGTRIVVVRYLASCAMGAKNPRDWAHLMSCFATPYNASDGIAPLVLSLANAYLGGRDAR